MIRFVRYDCVSSKRWDLTLIEFFLAKQHQYRVIRGRFKWAGVHNREDIFLDFKSKDRFALVTRPMADRYLHNVYHVELSDFLVFSNLHFVSCARTDEFLKIPINVNKYVTTRKVIYSIAV